MRLNREPELTVVVIALRCGTCPEGPLIIIIMELLGVFTQAAGRVRALTPTSQRVHTPWMGASPVSPVRE